MRKTAALLLALFLLASLTLTAFADEPAIADPSYTALGTVFGTAVNQYINDELGYSTDRPY